jgi:transposase
MHGLVVSAADVQDRDMVAPMMAVVRRVCSTIERAIADGGYQGAATAAEVMQLAGIPLEIVKRTFGWLGRCRRLAKDFEHHMRSHAAFVILAMIRMMLRRIARLRQAM